MESINTHRKQLNDIDNQIIKLLNKRFLISKEIGTIKKNNNIGITDGSREQEIYNNISSDNTISSNENIVNVYKQIITESKKIQLSL